MRLTEASGKKILLGMLILALAMTGTVFWIGKKERDARIQYRKSDPTLGMPGVSSDVADSVSAWWEDAPRDYVRVTPIEGMGLVRYEPCTSPVATLSLVAVPGFFPVFECEFCDSLGRAEAVSGSRRPVPLDSATTLTALKVGLDIGGTLELLPVQEIGRASCRERV